MPYTCPQCSKDDSLIVTAMIELLPDEWSDEIEVEIVECSCCRFRGVAVDEESRRVPWIGVHPPRGLPRGGRGIRGVERRDQTLPDPANRGCTCPSHRSVAQALAWGEELRGELASSVQDGTGVEDLDECLPPSHPFAQR